MPKRKVKNAPVRKNAAKVRKAVKKVIKSRGRPPFEITDEVLAYAEEYASNGLSQDQIALCLGMGSTTLYEKKNEYPDFAEAIKSGQARGIRTVTNALMESAKAGNQTAQIFYLQNRAPDNWKDRRNVEHTGHISQTIEHRSVQATDTRIEELFGNGKDQHPAPPVSH